MYYNENLVLQLLLLLNQMCVNLPKNLELLNYLLQKNSITNYLILIMVYMPLIVLLVEVYLSRHIKANSTKPMLIVNTIIDDLLKELGGNSEVA